MTVGPERHDAAAVIRTIRVIPSNPPRSCALAQKLRRHLTAGRLPTFIQEFNRFDGGEGTCHSVSEALMGDLSVAGAADGWQIRSAWIIPTGGDSAVAHSYMAFDGWALDASRGACLIMSEAEYRAAARAKQMTLEEMREFFGSEGHE